MKRMLINATHSEELRVALVDGQRLYDLDIENRAREQTKANIYKARVTRVEPSLEAAFVDFGADRHGFLPLKEISRKYFKKKPGDLSGRLNIAELIEEGQELIVQVDKEERGTKGAALSTFVSLAGRYLVLMPNNPRAGGVSRRVEGEDRDMLRQALSELEVPAGMGVIVRTAGVGRNTEELQWDLDYLMQAWDAIQSAADENKAPVLLYQENNLILRAIRDYLRPDIGEVLIDSETAHAEAVTFIEQVMPHYRGKIRRYEDSTPLFTRFQIESQIESAFQRDVTLPSGGALVLDPTEALVSIDINSSRATRGADIEETALQTNIEAAEEIARQLRLRDMGGLIVIDFIDMASVKNQRTVENKMREAVEMDRARVQVGRISRFGLMEMSRQRLRPSLEEVTTIVCPRCNGQGNIRNVKSLALSIIRVMEEECLKERSAIVRAIVPIAIGAYLLNEKRADLAEIERRTQTHLVIVPSPTLETPHFEVQRLRDDHAAAAGDVPSYELAEVGEDIEEALAVERPAAPAPKEAVVKTVAPTRPAPQPATAPPPAPSGEKPALLSRVLSMFTGRSTNVAPQPPQRAEKQPQESRSEPSRRRRPRRSGDAQSTREAREDRNGDRRKSEGKGQSARESRGRREAGERGNTGRREARDRRPARGRREERPQREEKARREGRSREEGPKEGEERKRADRNQRSRPERKEPSRVEAGAAEPTTPRTEEPRAPEAAQSKRKPRRDRSQLRSDVAPAAAHPAETSGGSKPDSTGKEPLQEMNLKDAMKSLPTHSMDRASNDPRTRRRQQAMSSTDAADSEETTRRNPDVEPWQDAGERENAGAPVDTPDSPSSSASPAPTPSPDDVPTVQASLKVSLQPAGRETTEDAQPAESAQVSEGDDGDTEAQTRASNDPRARLQASQGGAEGSSD